MDVAELAAGLGVLCGGTASDKVRAAFELFDLDGDGYITREEMTAYMTSVFRMLYATGKSGVSLPRNVDAERLAEITTAGCFADADVEGTGRLSFDAFEAWYSAASPAGAAGAGAGAGTGAGAGAGVSEGSAMADLLVDSAPSWGSLNELKAATHLDKLDIETVMRVFDAAAQRDPEGDGTTIGRAAFDAGFGQLLDAVGAPSDSRSRRRTHAATAAVFDLFDLHGTGRVSLDELAAGLSILCRGAAVDRVRAAFGMYDLDHDGFISHAEMRTYLTAVYRLIFASSPGTQRSLGVTPEILAEVTTDRCFAEADADRDGRLSFEEFKEWFVLHPGQLPGAETADAVTGSPSGVGGSPPRSSSAALTPTAIHDLLRLSQYSTTEVFDTFREHSRSGVLTRSAFRRAFFLLAQLAGGLADATAAAAVNALVGRLFVLFDRDNDGVVTFEELASGLTVFCSGDPDDKIKAAFALVRRWWWWWWW